MNAGLALRARQALEVLRAHPRHVVLLALVIGMLAARAPLAVVLLAMLGAGVAGGVSACGLLAATAVMGGAVIAHERTYAVDRGPLVELIGSSLSGEVVLLEPPRARVHGGALARVRWLDGAAAGDVGLARLPPSPDRPDAIAQPPGGEMQVGEILQISARVVEFEPWEGFQRRRGAHAALQVHALHRTARSRTGVAGVLDAVRERGRRGLQAGSDSEDAAVLRGMVLGEDHAIDETVREDFERSGLAHLLAVSGQNVMLLSVLVLAVGAVVGSSLRSRLALALALVLLYVPLTGAGPSIQRAGVMGAAGLVAAMAGRPASRWYALILAAGVTLAVNPHAVTEPGWQLSFAAVIGLLAGAAPCIEGLVRRAIPRLLAEVMTLTVLATIATAPLLAHHFGELSLVSLISNLMAAPAVAPVMWLGMVAIAVSQIDPSLASPLTTVNAPLVAYIEWIAHVTAQPADATVAVQLSWPGGVVAAYAAIASAIGVTAVLMRSGPAASARRYLAGDDGARDASRRRVIVVVTASVGTVLVTLAGAVGVAQRDGAAPQPAPEELIVSFLDVGQGDATLLQTDASAVLFDTGPPDGPILERLEEAGVKRLDALVITHAQADHEGAALAVIERFEPGLVLNGGAGWKSGVQSRLGAAVRASGSRMVATASGQAFELDGVRVEALWPPPLDGMTPSGDPNLYAVVAHVQHGEFDLLLPADAESDVLSRLELPRVEALKVSHHGSEDTGLPAMLERLQPAIAAIEVGRDNSYGHPAPSTLAALRSVPRVARTDRDGTVRLRVRGRELTLDP